MKKPVILSLRSSSSIRKLRNGKILSPRKNTRAKKKSIIKTKNGNQLPFLKTSNDLDCFHLKNEKEILSHEMMVTNKKYNNLVKNRELYILLEKIPSSIINKVPLDDQNINNNNKNCYTNLEDYIQLNEVQIYNELKPKIETKPDPIKSGKIKRTVIPSKSLKKNTYFETETKTCDHDSSTNQDTFVRMTRRKKIQLQTEERKQLDKIMFDRFPNNTFKMFCIQLDDITEEVKFLRTLGLTCRFKCPLSNCKIKK